MASNVTVLNKVLYFLLFISIIKSSKLNVPHVLLPIFSTVNVNFTLEAVNGGCYKWSTTRIDLVQLTYIEPNTILDCSQKAVVSAISKERNRNVAVVLAEEVNTQFVLRVDVIVDVIDTLKISTTTKEIIMDEVPEIFKVVAFDSQGNLFTTLEGVEFNWKIHCLGANKDLTVLRFMTFRESPYETPPSIKVFEEENKRGHIVLLEGIKTGTAKVQVKLPYEEYNSVKLYEVQLSVVANLIILPADVYSMTYDIIHFKIYSMNNGKMEEIALPNTQYYLDVEDKSIASADRSTGQVTALKEGRTRVVLHDINVDEKDPGLKLPSSSINVVQPTYMTLNLLPYNNWDILLSEHHDILVEVFSNDNHRLYLGPTVQLHTQVGESFHIQQRSANGSWLVGWAHNEGIAPVQAVLEGVVHPRFGESRIEPLTASKDITIHPRIILSPSDIILPWDSIARPKYHVELRATGGDGKFVWSSSNHSIGMVNQMGHVKTHFHGYFEVTAAMQKNHHNRESAKINILPPSRLEIIEYVNEAEVGSPIFLHIALYAEKTDKDGQISHIPFTQCQELPFKIKTSDVNFVYNHSSVISPVGVSCANAAIVGQIVGSSKITVTYNKDGKFLEDSVHVNTYQKLKLLYPSSDVVLAVGTTKQLIFMGGPKQSLAHPDGFSRKVYSENPTIVEAVDSTDFESMPGKEDYAVVRVLCRYLGETYVTLSIANMPIIPSCKNPGASVTVKVICGKPRSISLQPEIKVADAESCPMDLSAEKVVVQSNHDIELDVIVRDENGLRFLNISSLKFAWSILPNDLGALTSRDKIITRSILEGTLNYAEKSYQIVTPKTDNGLITVHAKIVGYHLDVLKIHRITPEIPEFLDGSETINDLPPLAATIILYLVDDAIVTPNEITLYNHPGNKKILPIKQGSGYYKLALSTEDVADVRYLSASKEIEISPQSDGDLRVHLIDLCLVSKPAVITINVVSVHVIRVEMSDKVEINKCIPCIVKLYDENDNLFPLPNLDMIEFKVQMENNIVNAKRLTPDPSAPWGDGEIHYILTGQELGDTKLTFSIADKREGTSSAPLDLQVFPPLVLYPRNTTLIIGSTLHYYTKGGPQPQSNVEYSVLPDGVAGLSDTGILNGLTLGNAKVQARAIGVNPTTGQKVIYTQDSADVFVVPITGIKIFIPLARFKVQSKVPVWANGLPDQISPVILGTVDDSFTFDWDVDDPNIIRLEGVFDHIGVNYKPQDQVVTRIVGISPGTTKLRLNVTVSGIAAACPKQHSVTFTDAIDIDVFEGLELTEPKAVSSKSVLMAPYSILQIRTNMDSVSRLSYKLIGEDTSDSRTQRSLTIPDPLVTITDDGVLRSHGNMGYSMVLIIAQDEHGLIQTLSIIVEVKPIYYMMLNVVSNWMIVPNAPSNVVPLGTEFQLHVTYHDNTGNVFTAGTAELHVRTSRFDLTKVKPGKDNSTLIVSLKKPGTTVLKVWANGIKRTADYLKLRVEQTVTPTVDHLVAGDVLCLWTPVTASGDDKYKWTTSDSSLLDIDISTGIGFATTVKGGHVAISHSLHPGASLQLQILPISQIKLLNPNEKATLTNAAGSKGFEVPLVIHSESSIGKESNLLSSWHCRDNVGNVIKSYPFTCHIEFSNASIEVDVLSIFSIGSSFNPQTGLYSCKITSTGVTDPNISILETSVIIIAQSVSNDVVSNPVEIPFLPAVYYEQDLTLDDNAFTADLIIVGADAVLNEVSVEPSDSNLLSVSSASRPSRNILKYEVRLLDYHWKLSELDEPLTLQLYSKATDERGKIHTKIQSADRFNKQGCSVGGRTAIGGILYNNRHLLAVVISMMVIFFVTFYAYSYYIQPVINVNVQPTASLLTGNRALVSAQRVPTGSPPPPPGTCHCTPGQPHQCSPPRMSRTFNTTNYGSTLNASYGSREPVYGDPNSFYCTSPEVRRNRRMM